MVNIDSFLQQTTISTASTVAPLCSTGVTMVGRRSNFSTGGGVGGVPRAEQNNLSGVVESMEAMTRLQPKATTDSDGGRSYGRRKRCI